MPYQRVKAILSEPGVPCYVRAANALGYLQDAQYPNSSNYWVALITSPTRSLAHAGIVTQDGKIIVPGYNDLPTFIAPITFTPSSEIHFDSPDSHSWQVFLVGSDPQVAKASIEYRNRLIALEKSPGDVSPVDIHALRSKTAQELQRHTGHFGNNLLLCHSQLEIRLLSEKEANQIDAHYADEMLLSPESVLDALRPSMQGMVVEFQQRDVQKWIPIITGFFSAEIYPAFVRELADLLPVTFQDWKYKKALATGLIATSKRLGVDWSHPIGVVKRHLQLVHSFREETLYLIARHSNLVGREDFTSEAHMDRLRRALRIIANVYKREDSPWAPRPFKFNLPVVDSSIVL
ncbi:MAG: hypothetical protein AAB874_00525 [Patescibacteria group bacterium]